MVACLQSGPAAAQVVVTQGTNLSADVSRVDGRLAMDLLGSIWILPPQGGQAMLIGESPLPATRPRWSPDGRQIIYQATAAGLSQLWLLDLESAEQQEFSGADYFDRDAIWHPDGTRVTFSSDRHDSGFDIWETDLQTGLQWRLSDHPGDETEPAWSASGRDLAFILRDGDHWLLMLRRFGQPDVELVRSDTQLAAPSWRPDGTLITYLQKTDKQFSLHMAILSDPPLLRELASGEDFSLAPVSWANRNQLFYTSDGQIKTRGFDEWTARAIPFRATVGEPAPKQHVRIANREIPLLTPPGGQLVIRAGRIFDGLSRRYRDDVDVLLDGGLIADITPRRQWDGVTVLELSNTTLLPGLIDAYSALPELPHNSAGAELLSWGITTLVSPEAGVPDPALWEGDQQPGPRLLLAASVDEVDADSPIDDAAVYLLTIASNDDNEQQREVVFGWQQRGRPVLAENWLVGLSLGANLILGVDALPEYRYQDVQIAAGSDPLTLISGLADAGTPGLTLLFRARQAGRFRDAAAPVRRLASVPDLRGSSTRVVAGSRPNELPPGLSLHAELRALAASGMAGDQVLKAAGSNAARILGLSAQIGEISPGARADLVLVAGDPLTNVADILKIVAVVRNGRFYSLISLLERANPSVE